MKTRNTPLGVLCSEEVSDWHQHQLSSDQVEQFWRDGYLSNVPVLIEEQCQLLLSDYKTFLDPNILHDGHGLFYEFHRNQSGDDDNVLLHALGQWRMSRAFHDLCFLPQIVCRAAQLVHPSQEPSRLRFWHDQLFAKPPHHGGVVAWHQDYSYWTRTKPMMHITVHVALDDQTGDRGGLQFIPGSHRWHRNGMPLPITDASFGDMQSVHSVLTEEERQSFNPVAGSLKRGEASFHHPLTIHGSYANKSEFPRRAAVVNYFADGVCSDSEEPLLSGVPAVAPGHRMEGQFFPLVYDPAWAA
jgi:hypothetical protein